MPTKNIGDKANKATLYLDCWMTEKRINELKSYKVMFKNIK